MKVDLRRNFLDNIKKNCDDMYILLFEKLKEYIDKKNIEFNKFNNFIGDTYKDFKLIDVIIYNNIRKECGIDTSKTSICQQRRNKYNLDIILYNSYSSSLIGIENLYYKDFSIKFKYSKFDWNKIRGVSKKYIHFFLYDTMMYIIPNLYKELANILFKKLDISKDEYYIQFDKLYNIEEYKKKYDCEVYINQWENKLEPFICFSLNKLFNIETGDTYNKEKDDIESYNNNYYYYRDDTKSSFIIFPFSNVIRLKNYNYEEKYIGEAFDYGYNKLPCLTATKEVREYDKKTHDIIKCHTDIIESNLSNFFPVGYFTPSIVIGNIFNDLYCNIVNKNSKEQFIIQFNHFGIKPSIVYNSNSIKSIINYKRKNNDMIRNIDNTILSEKENLSNSINGHIDNYKGKLLNKLNNINIKLFNDYKNFVITEIDTNRMYNNGLAKDYYKNNDGSVLSIFPIIKCNDKFIDYIAMTPSNSLNTYIPKNIDSYMHLYLNNYSLKNIKDNNKFSCYNIEKEMPLEVYKEIEYKNLYISNYENKYYVKIEFGDTYEFKENNMRRYYFETYTNIKNKYWYTYTSDISEEEKEELINTREGIYKLINIFKSDVNNRYYFQHQEEIDREANICIVISQYIKPFLDAYIPNVIIPILKAEYTNNTDLLEAFKEYKKLEEINKKIKKEKDNSYESFTLDSISDFAQEANYFNEKLDLSTVHLFSLFKS